MLGKVRVSGPVAVSAVGVFRLILLLSLCLSAAPVFSEITDPEVTAQTVEVPETGTQTSADGSTPIRFLNAGRNQTYLVADGPLTPEQKTALDRLSPDQQRIFNERRIGFLQRSLTVINLSRLTVGTGVYLKDKFLNVVTGGRHEMPDRTIGERGHQVVQRILHALNQQLFDHLDVVARSNEFGLTVTLGGAGGIGWGRHGLYEGVGVGISIGYNHHDRAAAFEVFVDHDRFVSALPAVASFRVGGKLYGYATHDTPETSGRFMRSRSTFLPGSLGVMDSERSVQAGANLHLGMGFIPALSVEFSNDRLPLVKLTVSPVRKGMIVGSGALIDLSRGALHTVAHVTGAVIRQTARYSGQAAVRCWAALTGLFHKSAPPL